MASSDDCVPTASRTYRRTPHKVSQKAPCDALLGSMSFPKTYFITGAGRGTGVEFSSGGNSGISRSVHPPDVSEVRAGMLADEPDGAGDRRRTRSRPSRFRSLRGWAAGTEPPVRRVLVDRDRDRSTVLASSDVFLSQPGAT